MNQSRMDGAASTSAQGGVLGSLKPPIRLKFPAVSFFFGCSSGFFVSFFFSIYVTQHLTDF